MYWMMSLDPSSPSQIAHLDSVPRQISPNRLHIPFLVQVPYVNRLFTCRRQQSSLFAVDTFMIDSRSESDTRRGSLDLSVET